MQPENTTPPPTNTPPANPYEFILNETPPPKKRWGGSTFQRAILLAGGFFTLLTLGLLLFALLGGENDQTKLQVSVGVQQRELIRIAELGVKDATGSDTKGYANTIKSTLLTDHSALQAQVTDKIKKEIETQATIQKDTSIDQALERAGLNNAYDKQLYEVFELKLAAYQTTLRSAFDATTSSRLKAVYGTAHTNAGNLVLEEVPEITPETTTE